MKRRTKIFIPLLVFSFLLFITSSYLIFQKEKEEIKKDIEFQLFTYSINIKEYFLNAQALIYSLKYTLEDKMQLTCCSHPSFDSYKYYKDKNITLIENHEGIKALKPSILNLKGDMSNNSYEKNKEINSALHLKPIFNASHKILPDLIWVYYTSNEKFIYISPKYEVEDDKKLEALYKIAFWTEAIPKNNPEKKLVVTDLYDDGAGQGLMITLSKPVFSKDIFKGVVSVDLGLKSLNDLLPKNDYLGETFLSDEKEQIVSSKSKFNLGDKKFINSSDDIKIEIIKNQIKLLHIFNEEKLSQKALDNASTQIIIALLLIFLTLIALYLKVLLDKVQYYANTDSLTKLLNRRAMQREINLLINTSRRYEHDLSFLSIDIDFFKKINDKFGHQIGDKVLVEIAKLFKRKVRKCDIIARYGGEEFLIALSNTSLEEAYILAERIRTSAQKIKIDKCDINLTISIGCTALRKKDNYFTILKRVDKLLYEAKDSGRDKTVKDEEN